MAARLGWRTAILVARVLNCACLWRAWLGVRWLRSRRGKVRSLHFLIVDDEEDVATVLPEVLELRGQAAAVVGSPEEGLRLLAGKVVVMTGETVAGPSHMAERDMVQPVGLEKPFTLEEVAAVLRRIS